MKKILLLFSLITLVGCSQFSARKDQSQQITFKSSIPEGKYNFNLVSFKYPENYNDKINFLKNLNNTLENLNAIQKENLNLLITNEMDIDFNSLFSTGWLDKEILGMKIVEDLENDEKIYLNKLNIGVPTEAGENQKLLNRQYFLLLQLTDNEALYNPEFLYTELDKSLLMEDVLLNRKSLIENINSIKKNFVYSDSISDDKKIIYIKEKNRVLETLINKSVIFQNSNINSGFRVLPNSLVLFPGNENKKYLSTEDYEFTSSIVSVVNFEELQKITNASASVSKLASWERKKRIENNTTESLELRFSNWEVK